MLQILIFLLQNTQNIAIGNNFTAPCNQIKNAVAYKKSGMAPSSEVMPGMIIL